MPTTAPSGRGTAASRSSARSTSTTPTSTPPSAARSKPCCSPPRRPARSRPTSASRTAQPDYGGVGNISSIDSGLWVIIAFYHYVVATGDHDFLREHSARLQVAMNWLSAHDSNNDGLLEIPEAGDWTDLFGRSYNVLYDEVLWFRTNVCFGRLLEFQGDYERAADYLRWSQRVRGRLLDTFWPTMRPPARPTPPPPSTGSPSASSTSATPSTCWPRSRRSPSTGGATSTATCWPSSSTCSTSTRARTAFRFMWGVGVNDPWPVANLYPVVQAGDPDWRTYYTVNLLNLPHHYHNGGIWPFIGGLWVRFIHRLGFHEVACRELVRLGAAQPARPRPRMGVQRMGARRHRPAHGQGLPGLVRRLVHQGLPGSRGRPGAPEPRLGRALPGKNRAGIRRQKINSCRPGPAWAGPAAGTPAPPAWLPPGRDAPRLHHGVPQQHSPAQRRVERAHEEQPHFPGARPERRVRRHQPRRHHRQPEHPHAERKKTTCVAPCHDR